MTPEGKIKRKISNFLKEYLPDLWYDMPVPGGMGKSTLDYIGLVNGKFFAIEAKAPGKEPTARQYVIINQIRTAGGRAFIIRNDEDLEGLKFWVRSNT